MKALAYIAVGLVVAAYYAKIQSRLVELFFVALVVRRRRKGEMPGQIMVLAVRWIPVVSASLFTIASAFLAIVLFGPNSNWEIPAYLATLPVWFGCWVVRRAVASLAATLAELAVSEAGGVEEEWRRIQEGLLKKFLDRVEQGGKPSE